MIVDQEKIIKQTISKIEEVVAQLRKRESRSDKMEEGIAILTSAHTMFQAMGSINIESPTSYFLLIIYSKFLKSPIDCDDMCATLLRIVSVVEGIDLGEVDGMDEERGTIQ